MIMGTPKFSMADMKVRMAPERMVGRTRGKETVRNVLSGLDSQAAPGFFYGLVNRVETGEGHQKDVGIQLGYKDQDHPRVTVDGADMDAPESGEIW